MCIRDRLYAAEATAGTRPTTGYEKISEIKSIPELNPEPDNLETTTLEETEWKTYVPGLKDIGGALSFTANLTEASMTEWEGVVDAYDTAAAGNKATWFCIVIPGLTKALYFTGQPSPMGMPAMEVSAVLETTLYITPVSYTHLDVYKRQFHSSRSTLSSIYWRMSAMISLL